MDCREIRDSLDAFIDGELEKNQAAAVEAHLEGCEACHGEFLASSGLSDLLREGLTDVAHAAADEAAEAGRFESMWANIEAEITAPEQSTATAPGLWERLRTWWSEQMQQPVWIPAAAAAATLVIILGLVIARQQPSVGSDAAPGAVASAPVEELPPFAEPRLEPKAVADNTTIKPKVQPRRREAEGMVAHNEAFIIDYEVDRGIVLIDQDPDEPDQPMVVWHIVDEDAPNGMGSEG